MFFLGFSFLGADEMTLPISPTAHSDNTAVEVSNAMVDTFAITKDINTPLTEEVKTVWDFDTILIAEFDGDTIAGNIKWELGNITHVLIKRRIKGDHRWITLAVQEVHVADDLNIRGTDLTCEGNIYEYAIVPILNYDNTNIEGIYSITEVKVTNTDLVVLDRTGVYSTPLTDGFCDVTDVHPNATLELLRNVYPTIVRNTLANYETINVTGNFIPYDSNDCLNLDVINDDMTRVLYSREVKRFLTNGLTKILKNVDGQAWLVYVTTPPTDSADGYYNVRKLTFGCTETGDLRSQEDLYYAGLLDVPEEWWSV